MLLIFGYLLISISVVFGSTWTNGDYNGYIDNNVLMSMEKIANPTDVVNMSGQVLEGIHQQAFKGMDTIKTLILANNRLSSLPELVFLPLPNLRILSLQNNRLSHFKNVFMGPKNLTSLNIMGNPLNLTPRSFAGLDDSVVIQKDDSISIDDWMLFKTNRHLILLCSNAESIVTSVDKVENIEKLREAAQNCRKSNLVEVNSDILSLEELGITGFEEGWYRLEYNMANTLNLSGNKIIHPTSTMLNDLPWMIHRVILNKNHIERLENGIINNKYLSRLEFEDCSISEIENNALVNTNLRYLSLSNNSLTNINFAKFLPTTLEQLILSHNKIVNVPANTFSTLNKLEILRLEWNEIMILEKGVFNGLENIKNLFVHHNKLTEISHDSFDGLPDTLEGLYLQSNEITKLKNGTFVNIPQNYLQLSDNKIEDIENGTFNLTKLHEVVLIGNLLTIIKNDTFSGLPNVKIINLRQNPITKIEKSAREHIPENALILTDMPFEEDDEEEEVSTPLPLPPLTETPPPPRLG